MNKQAAINKSSIVSNKIFIEVKHNLNDWHRIPKVFLVILRAQLSRKLKIDFVTSALIALEDTKIGLNIVFVNLIASSPTKTKKANL